MSLLPCAVRPLRWLSSRGLHAHNCSSSTRTPRASMVKGRSISRPNAMRSKSTRNRRRSGFLSLRGPINVAGTFRNPRVSVSSEVLLRGGAAIALGVVNPLAALLPLIETGPGEDAHCSNVLAPVEPAVKQASKNRINRLRCRRCRRRDGQTRSDALRACRAASDLPQQQHDRHTGGGNIEAKVAPLGTTSA